VAYTDVLLRRARGRPQADPDEIERLGRIGESAGRMLRFTRDLVSYARPSSEVAVPLAIHTVIEQALAFCEHVLGEAGAQAERRYASDIPLLAGMPEQLTQVFVNLITNACHAIPAGKGLVIIATERTADGRWVQITIEDNGHGVDPAHLPRVFVPFFTTKGDGRGTGLGLSIVRNIVEAHGGQIYVSNVTPQGARFTLLLPVTPA
jgi:two-component system NtrC family sensor kinase